MNLFIGCILAPFSVSEIQFRCHVAVDIVAHGLFHKVLGYSKTFSQITYFSAAVCYGFVQIVAADQGLDGPFVGAVFVPPAGIYGCLDIVEAAGDAVAQFMGQLQPFVIGGSEFVGIDGDIAEAVLVHEGKSFSFLEVKAIYFDILFVCDLVEL